MTLAERQDEPATGLSSHPLADLFPLMQGAEFDALVEDVRANGVREEIILLDSMILDGRNRYRAGIAAGVFPADVDPSTRWEFVTFEDLHAACSPLAFVISKNLTRRHLDESQRAMIAAKLARRGAGRPEAAELIAPIGAISQPAAAELLNVGRRSVQRAGDVIEHGTPELAEAVATGATSVAAAAEIARLPVAEQKALLLRVAEDPNGRRALRDAAKEVRAETQKVRHVQRQERAEKLSARDPELPAGRTFPLVLIDVPRKDEQWSEETGSEKSPSNHYKVMDFVELLAFPIDRFAARDCLIAYWSTAASLVDDLDILAEWGFVALRPRGPDGKLIREPDGSAARPVGAGRYGSHQVWRKIRRGRQTGMGRWVRDQHEILILARRGDVPAPLPGTQPESVLEAPCGDHSEKPGEEVRAWLDRCFPQLAKIEIFARGVAPEGWAFWGNEAGEAFGTDPHAEEPRSGVSKHEAAA